VVFETRREVIGLVEALLGCSGHWHHLRYFGLAGMAWTMTGPSLVSMTLISYGVGVVWSDEHGQPSSKSTVRMGFVEDVENIVVNYAMPTCALGDQRRLH
jgi:hypothetical protein